MQTRTMAQIWQWSMLLTLVAIILLPTKAIAQQGTSQSLGGVVAAPNGDSMYVGTAYRDGNYYLFFASYATNLLPGGNPPGFFVKNLRTGQVAQIASFSGGVWSASVNTTGTRFAAIYQLPTGTREMLLAELQGENWGTRVQDAAGNFVVATDAGFFYSGQRDIFHLPTIGSRPRSIYSSDVVPVLMLTASSDGEIVAATYGEILSRFTVILRGPAFTPSIFEGVATTSLSSTGEYIAMIDRAGSNIFYQLRREEEGRINIVEVDRPSAVGTIVDLRDPSFYVYMDGGRSRLYRDGVDYPLHPVEIVSTRLPYGQQRYIVGHYVGLTVLDNPTARMTLYDRNLRFDVFLHDVGLMQTIGGTIGPRPTSGIQSDVAIGRDTEAALASNSPNLVQGKTTSFYDIFVSSGNTLTRIMGEGNVEPNGDSFSPSILGNRVVFASYASNLTRGDVNNASDIFLYEGGSLINITPSANGDSFSPILTDQGVVFLTFATNLIPVPDGLGSQAVQYDQRTGGYRLFTYNGEYFDEVEAVAAAPNGSFVALSALRGSEAVSSIYLFDSENHLVGELPNDGVYSFTVTDVSNNGMVVFHTRARLAPEDTNDALDVYLWGPGMEPQLISKNPVGSVGNGDSYGGTINAGGARVAFSSRATNLVPLDVNGEEDAFIYDLENQRLYCASLSAIGIPEGGAQSKLNSSGTHIAFVTGNPQHAGLPFTEGSYVAIHQIGCVPTGDVDRNGVVEDADLLTVLFSFGNAGGSLADLNVDGTVDDSDLLVVLLHFGESCTFGVADGGAPHSDEYELRDGGNGRLVMYYHTLPTVKRIDTETTQRRDIDFALYTGEWPYPTVGGMINLWKQHFGDPIAWTPEERAAMRHAIFGDGTSFSGDFVPATGGPFTWTWDNTYAYQPRSDTYIRFKPRLQFDANACTNFYHAQVEGTLDLKLFGYGRDELAKFKARAGMTPGWLGWEAKAWFNGSQVWSDGWYQQSPSWSITRTYSTGSITLFTASYNFNIYGVPCVADIRVSGYANASLGLTLNASPPDVQASFTPAIGANAVFTGGIGGSIAGITVAAGLQINFAPFLELSLPTTARAWTSSDGGRCYLNANTNVRLTLRALAGSLRAGIFSSCLGGWVCKKCNAGDRQDILGWIPAYCCSDACSGPKKKRYISASFQVANWSGLSYNLATILDRPWQWQIK